MSATRLFLLLWALVLAGCSSFGGRDPLQVDLAGMEPLAGEGLEVRFTLKLRVQNPNESAIHYSGVALELEVNDLPLASGVSSQGGTVAGFGETLIEVPVTLSAFSVLRQAWNLGGGAPLQNVPYALRGKLGGGLWGTRRFSDAGVLSLPEPRDTP
ncbi:LEA type 2 family protein [Metapseudomonas furukawaii]|uniref:Lipoprotein, putative n=1 Tax=Metapseudomonas furukawaii TaxID=1149133 RepID=A0AAD1C4B0_METFU|nr:MULTISPECIES: LEA type 2 family protein [Pseudomonas]ELS26837.1 putative Lipoprotein [Pseudomonas furukawaii]OWJ89228.1 water stress/hypersensitive response domain-containing protein [Pseudomonas sp. A46]BAU76697.1 lipoprotein, putative [Pseudomonas furukawaii]